MIDVVARCSMVDVRCRCPMIDVGVLFGKKPDSGPSFGKPITLEATDNHRI